MVDAAVSFAVQKLGEFVTQQVNIRLGVKDNIVWLKNELGYLLISVRAAEAHLDRFSAQQKPDHIRLWKDSVTDVANEAVIILDKFTTQQNEDAAHEKRGVLDRMRSCICICKKEANLYDISNDIELLKEKVIGIKSRKDEYHIDDIIKNTPDVQQRKRTFLRAASFDHEKDVIGFEDDVRNLLAQLGNEDPSLGLISIHGMGGLGKSTLASKLYHSSELSYFKSRAWVCVSEEYEITHVLRMIIKSLMGDKQDSLKEKEKVKLNEMEEVDLRRHLRKILVDGDHYLVVIDDIWDVEVWEKIKNVFPDKKNGSRVIITTRNRIVAEGVDDTCFVHELRFLREDESWQLFCKRAKPTPNLEILGKEMVGKCGGLPLAIVILSGLLLQKKTYTFWSEVKEHLWKRLKGKSSEIQELLNLSYDDLSFDMKPCFLYLARYPEDQVIQVFELKLLWIAEGFLSEAEKEDGVVMEDLAENYVNELINRNMIQIELLSAEGQVLACRVHDLVRDLAREKAMEHKILGIFHSSDQNANPNHFLQEQARQAIHGGIGEYFKFSGPNYDSLKLRSLALIKETSRLQVEEMKLLCMRFKYLKVLDLTAVKNSEGIPEEIGDLIYLKFLGLMGGGTLKRPLVIPPSTGKLKKLQSICGSNSYYSYVTYIFPKEICELKELRHLMFSYNEGTLNISSDQTKLQTLYGIMYREWSQIDTTNLTNLRTLVIKGSKDLLSREDRFKYMSLESIANLLSLQTLIIKQIYSTIPTIKPLWCCKQLKRVQLAGTIKDPASLSFLPASVTDLTLRFTRFEEDPMPILGSLSNLTALYLCKSAFLGDKMVCSADAFPCLQFLKLEDLRDLEELQIDEGALPCLKAFEIDNRDNRIQMNKIPQRITSLPPVPNLWGYFC